jgi:hypothetical protein
LIGRPDFFVGVSALRIWCLGCIAHVFFYRWKLPSVFSSRTSV